MSRASRAQRTPSRKLGCARPTPPFPPLRSAASGSPLPRRKGGARQDPDEASGTTAKKPKRQKQGAAAERGREAKARPAGNASSAPVTKRGAVKRKEGIGRAVSRSATAVSPPRATSAPIERPKKAGVPKAGTSRAAVNHRRSSTDPLAAHGYTTQSPIAAGAFSMIVRAVDNTSGKQVAVKTFNKAKVQKDPSLWQVTCREISVLQHLNSSFHPHLANLLALHDNPISVHLVLEYCDGASLQRVLQKLGVNIGMAENKVAELTAHLCSGLGHVHSQGIAHRDVKPSNVVFVTAGDGRESVKMVDFGFAIRCGDERCYTNCGTPIYMAPEQNKSKPAYLGPPVDCWAREYLPPNPWGYRLMLPPVPPVPRVTSRPHIWQSARWSTRCLLASPHSTVRGSGRLHNGFGRQTMNRGTEEHP